MIYLSTLFLSLFITITAIPVLNRFANKLRILDIPDERKIHDRPMPRSGGIAIFLGVIVAAMLWIPKEGFFKGYLIGSAIIVFFGLMDDLKGITYKVKFAGQIIAAFVVVLYGGVLVKDLGSLLPDNYLIPNWLAVPFTVLIIVGVTNAINLSDGLDGLAGGITLLSFCCIGLLAYLILDGNIMITLISISFIGALFGFLRFNTYPATLFMGDTGSNFLGFSAITLSIALTQGNTPLDRLLPLIILGFPVLDAVSVMHERLAKGVSPFKADKNHFHHKLMGLGFFHTEAVFLIYVIQACLIISAFFLRFHSEWLLLISYIIFSSLILAVFHLADITKWKLRRFDIVDLVIKGHLRELKGKSLVISFFFTIIYIGIPVLLLFTCLVPKTIPIHFSILSAVFLVLILLTWFFKRVWMQGVLMLVLYTIIPFVTYFSINNPFSWMQQDLARLDNIFFVILVFSVVMTLKLTKRQQGFKATTMDFLILFVALVIPYIGGAHIHDRNLGLVVARTIALYFGYEVLMGEVRSKLGILTVSTLATLGLVIVRGLIA
ncbi:MAG: glycosyl transferase [Deltaproteobacteria bacterium RBG_16_42_7]|nr:MAG: glycosyl transferase [Deltaproteobacteria bacterium RBG_16_42_7]